MTRSSNRKNSYYSLSQPLNKLIDRADAYEIDAYWKDYNCMLFGHNSVQEKRFGNTFLNKIPAQLIAEQIETPKLVNRVVANDQMVCHTGTTQVFLEETNVLGLKTALSVKSPLYDSANNLVGIFGISFYLHEITLQKFFDAIHSVGLNLDFVQVSNVMFVNNIYPKLSHREADCASLLVRGKTAKETARILHLSHRTVEEYLIRLKAKFNCSNKSALIEALLLSKE